MLTLEFSGTIFIILIFGVPDNNSQAVGDGYVRIILVCLGSKQFLAATLSKLALRGGKSRPPKENVAGGGLPPTPLRLTFLLHCPLLPPSYRMILPSNSQEIEYYDIDVPLVKRLWKFRAHDNRKFTRYHSGYGNSVNTRTVNLPVTINSDSTCQKLRRTERCFVNYSTSCYVIFIVRSSI